MGNARMQKEARNLTCPSFHDGRLQTPHHASSREQIGGYSDHLECTLAEREVERVAANHVRDVCGVAPDTHPGLLARALDRVETLALPAFVVTQDWTVHAANTSFRHFV